MFTPAIGFIGIGFIIVLTLALFLVYSFTDSKSNTLLYTTYTVMSLGIILSIITIYDLYKIKKHDKLIENHQKRLEKNENNKNDVSGNFIYE